MVQLDLNNIKQIDKHKNYVHEKVYTTYTIFCEGREKYVQIDTYGKSNREIPGKISQSIQLDKETAQYLVLLLQSEFNL